MLCPWRTGRLTSWRSDDESGTRPENSGHNSGDGDGFVRKTWIYNRYLRVPCVPYDKWYVMIFMQNLYVYVCIYIICIPQQWFLFGSNRQVCPQKQLARWKSDSYCEAIWVPVAVVAAISLAVLFFFSFDTLEYQARSNDWRDGGCVLRRLVSGLLWWCIDLSMIGWQWSIQ